MNDLRWTASEKKIARRAFDAALDDALAKIMAEFKARAAAATTPEDMWAIGDDLYRKRQEIDRIFDYRYSQLLLVFAMLIRKSYLKEEQLSGLSEEKIDDIRHLLSRWE
ncbi:MAG: hypothetical protein GEU89_16080 [Kiloniellaceae bacterium]|nr:hypothetical protein [Kiloniellaceae bacterium]